jgi:hypothetical protein
MIRYSEKDNEYAFNKQPIIDNLYRHVEQFSVKIGERHMWKRDSLDKAADYIQSEFQKYGYSYENNGGSE